MLATLSLSFAWAPWPLIAPKADECPAVTTVGSANFNLTEYVRKSWYIQAQQVESYQPLDSLYCVTATYDLDGATVPFFRGTVVTVYNYGNKGAVNGPNVNKNNMTLCARATNASDTSRLAVAPCFLPNLAAGPYWLLGVGADASGEYEWAVVIGGNPTVAYADGCTTSETGINNAGLWLFSRSPVASDATMAAMRDLLAAQNISQSRLHTVPHDGCKYAGAVLK